MLIFNTIHNNLSDWDVGNISANNRILHICQHSTYCPRLIKRASYYKWNNLIKYSEVLNFVDRPFPFVAIASAGEC